MLIKLKPLRLLPLLILLTLVTSCARKISPPQKPAQPLISNSVLSPVLFPQANGFTPQDLIKLILRQHAELIKVDCRLYEARRLSHVLADVVFIEKKPEYCTKSNSKNDGEVK